MSQYKVYVYAICKNEEKFVQRWMTSMAEADRIIVTDTGSTDGTVAALRALGAEVYVEQVKPWRFDEARNRSLAHVPEDADICVCTDLDEEFAPGWRKILEEAWLSGTTLARYPYAYSHDAKGDPALVYLRDKIHCRKGYRWIHPVHEYLEYEGQESAIQINALMLHHYPDATKSRGDYLPLMELCLQENPDHAQTALWLGRDYMQQHRPEDAIRTLQQYLAMPTATWAEERAAAMRYIAQCLKATNKSADAMRWLYRAIGESPNTREPYLDLARLAYAQADWPLVYVTVKKALEIKQPTGSYLVDQDCWNSTLPDLGAIACYQMNLYSQSLSYAKDALSHNVKDERLQKNLELIRAAAEKSKQ